MTTVTLEPPKPVTTLKPVPILTVRATMLAEIANAFGMPPEQVRILQEGYLDNLVSGVTIKGIAHDGFIADEATLVFSSIIRNANINIDVSGGRATTEAVSRVLAQAVMYSVNVMKRKGLRIIFYYPFTARACADPHLYRQTLIRFNLTDGGERVAYAPGYAPRRVFSVTPDADPGTTYTHFTARRVT